MGTITTVYSAYLYALLLLSPRDSCHGVNFDQQSFIFRLRKNSDSVDARSIDWIIHTIENDTRAVPSVSECLHNPARVVAHAVTNDNERSDFQVFRGFVKWKPLETVQFKCYFQAISSPRF